MEMDELFAFVDEEHERLVTHYNLKGDPKTKYTMFAKVIEEVGELSEAILTVDSFQRTGKLQENKTELSGEFADVLLTTLLLAKEMDVDPRAALEQKIAKIRARKY